MKKRSYFIDLDTGKISKEYRADWSGRLLTYGYRNAQAAARLCKKKDWEGACVVANRGITE